MVGTGDGKLHTEKRNYRIRSGILIEIRTNEDHHDDQESKGNAMEGLPTHTTGMKASKSRKYLNSM